MRWIGVCLCLVAAYRLTGTPLGSSAVAVAAASVLCALVPLLGPRVARSRLWTGSQHLLTALGAFFLFVSIAMR